MRIKKKTKAKPKIDPCMQAALDERARFENPAAWHTSAKGNRWRHWEGMTLTLFRREDDYFGWCIVDSERKRFSPCGYGEEEEAMYALMDELLIGLR